jgi:amidase/aspartyl-tRNA(Asn)/glutamyl-tRNA(Gln) amidotransferase subunit A
MNQHGDAAQMAAAVRQGEVSARELLTASLACIEATDARVNAFTSQTQARAFAEADAVDARRSALIQKGESLDALGPLAGVPYAVKNLYDIVGEVTLAGSVINRSLPPAEADAFLVKQMKAAGAVLVGALNMDEYAYGFTTENTHYGPCHNPHDLARISGGSSGGSGAAVAAGQVPVSLGSDTNGSIRVPASLCGVWGLKPTFGRLSRRGTYPFVHSIDHLGPMANSVTGLALAYDALQGPDAHDPGCHAQRVQPVAASLQQSSTGLPGLTGLRIGVLNAYFDEHASAAAREVVALAARTLGTTASVHWPDAGLARAAAFIITASEGGSLHLDDLRTQLASFEPLSVDRFIAGALQPADWYLRAQRFRRIYRDRIHALFTDWDVLITAATPVSAPLIGTEWIDINGTQQPCRAAMGLLTQPISFAGCPVVTAPMWPTSTGGMPLGVQIIAAPWREDLAFAVAQQLSDAGVAHVKIAAESSTTDTL